MNSGINITIPRDNLEERTYAIDFLFRDLLKVDYCLETSDSVNCYILVYNDKRINFTDDFWKYFKEPLSYLKKSSLPKVKRVTNQFIIEDDIPVLYGNGIVEVLDNEINCGIDVFASCFFMLTRWEEYVVTERDKHNRFSAASSIAFKENFLSRPVLNEYAEMIWNMLVFFGCRELRREKKFEIILTHDVDVLKTANPLRLFLGDLFKRQNLRSALFNLLSFFKDPVDTFSFLMNVSESIGVKSHFYFMSVSPDTLTNNPSNYLNSRRFRSLIDEIVQRDHIIGFHPGYFTYNDEDQWRKEKVMLETVTGIKVFEGRQHFLKLDIIQTLKIWDKNGMILDSTLGYADKEGFRCGTGDSFQVFDFLQRRKLKLIETPLILMDGSLKTYQKLSSDDGRKIIRKYLNLGKKYKMKTVFLFHNSSFDDLNWKGWKKIYKQVFNEYKEI